MWIHRVNNHWDTSLRLAHLHHHHHHHHHVSAQSIGLETSRMLTRVHPSIGSEEIKLLRVEISAVRSWQCWRQKTLVHMISMIRWTMMRYWRHARMVMITKVRRRISSWSSITMLRLSWLLLHTGLACSGVAARVWPGVRSARCRQRCLTAAAQLVVMHQPSWFRLRLFVRNWKRKPL